MSGVAKNIIWLVTSGAALILWTYLWIEAYAPTDAAKPTLTYLVLGDKKSKACIPNVIGVTLDHGSIVIQLTEGVLVLPANRHIVASLGAMPVEEGEQLCDIIMTGSPHPPTPKKNEIESAL